MEGQTAPQRHRSGKDHEVNMLKVSASLEDYLEAIAELIRCHGHAHTKEIASRLNVKMPSVTNALGVLSKSGHIVYQPNQPVQLTASGRLLAEKVIRRHHILQDFLQHVLELPGEEAGKTACKIEHVIDEKLIDRFLVLSEAVQNRSDCHGLRLHLNRTFTLSADE